MFSKTIIKEKIKQINGKPYTPVEVARMNNQVVYLALFDGEFHWHKHKKEDEFFYVYSGQIVIQLKNQEDITLSQGETTVIPKGIEHCPKSIEPSYVLFIEPLKANTKGD